MKIETELERVNAMLEEHGLERAIAFCKQGMTQYLKALQQRPKTYARDPLYRKSFVESLIVYRRFLISHQAYYS